MRIYIAMVKVLMELTKCVSLQRNDRAVSSLSFLLLHVTQVNHGEARNLEMPTDVDKKRP